jgi:glycosyltransferase involved in cell wall biosynthesis
MPTVLIDGTALSAAPKGVGRYSRHLIEQLAKRLRPDWSMSILVFDDCVPGRERSSRVRVIRVRRLPELVRALLVIPFLASRERADAVLLPMEVGAFARGRPIVAVLHDIDALIISAARQRARLATRLVNRIKQSFRIRMLRHACVVVCNSNFTAGEAVGRYQIDPSKVFVRYCGVDERFYSGDALHVRDWYPSVRNWRGYVLTFATGDPRERYDLCPEILSCVHAELPGIGLVVAGVRRNAAYVRELEAGFASYGLIEGRHYQFVDFLGEDEFVQLRALYREADFYLELSGHEGFGMQLAEAMATGTTCISSGRGALSEVGGSHAIGFAELEPTEIAATIVDAYHACMQLRDNRDQIEFTRRYCWDAVGALVAGKLEELRKETE